MNVLNYKITVEILTAKVDEILSKNVAVFMTPAPVASQTLEFEYPFEFNLSKIPLNISEPIKQTAYQFLEEILETYVDEDRELKTLLNFGEDRQRVIVSSRYGPLDASGTPTLQLKLLDPLPDEISSNEDGEVDVAFISREVANTVIQSARFFDAPPIDRTPYLRPKNTGITINDEIGKSLKNITLRVLNLETGSLGGFVGSNNISFEDSIFRQWYSYDFNSAELNIDFSDYNNFVLYGSAALRLQAFRQKLLEIEKLTRDSLQFEGGVFTGSLATAGAAYVLEQSAKFSKEKEDIIRSFDRYEQYLYFTPIGTNSPYSASFDFVAGETEFNEIGYWPKQSNGTLFPVNSEEAIIWFETQLGIAQRFDEFNENNLINTIPTHVREDEENAPFFTFVVMIGHFFDTIKPYIDQFPEIYSRYIDPDQELSKDLVSTIAESVGFKLPTIDSVYSLTESTLNTLDNASKRNFATESYKRLLHNIPLFAKSKGTRTALRSVLRTLGVTEQLIDIQESGLSDNNSIRITNEFYNAIRFTGAPAYIELPVSSSLRTPAPRSIQLNLTIDQNKDMTILSGDDLWKLDVRVNPTNTRLVKLQLSDSSDNVFMSTRYFENTSSDLLNISIRTFQPTSETSLRVIKVDQEDIIFDFDEREIDQFISIWNSTENIYVGGSGSMSTDNFIGKVDDVRLWGINLTDDNTLNCAFDPGSNAGNIFTDVSNHLYVQISLDKINQSLLLNSGSIINESPYKDKLVSPSLEFINVFGLTTESFFRDTRYVRQILPNIGSTGYVTNKVKIAPPPVFIENNETPGLKRLYRTESIVKLEDKEILSNHNKINISASPARLINQNIIRNIGLENINASYGIPNEAFRAIPNNLFNLRNHYNKFYFINVDSNRFIRIMSKVSSILNQVVDYFIPSRASVYTGVLIEPNLLERTKLPELAKIKFYGKGTRKTTRAAESSSLEPRDYAATFTLSEQINITSGLFTGSYITNDIEIDALLGNKVIASSSAIGPITGNSISTVSAPTVTLGATAGELSGNITKLESNLTEINKSVFSSINNLESDIVGAKCNILGNTLAISGSIGELDNILLSDFNLIDRQHLARNVRLVLESFKNVNDPGYNTSKELISRFPRKFLDRSVSVNLGLDEMDKFKFSISTGLGSPNAEPYNKIYPRKLFEYEILRPRSGGITSLTRRALYAIPPSCDLEQFGARNFFIQDFGVYYFTKRIRTPVYSSPLNATWDAQTETFEGATTWSYGERYNENDVVFQDIRIDAEYADTLGEQIIQSSIPGNGRFYVFKRRPVTTSESYEPIQRSQGEAYYSGSIPSTIPPFLDKENWAKLRFSPKSIPDPRRVVFDTFTIPDPRLNDFKTTTLDVSARIDLPQRFLDTFFIGSVIGTRRKLGEIKVQNIATLFATQLNAVSSQPANLRFRLYRSAGARDMDASRDSSEFPEPNEGVLLDMTFDIFGNIKYINPSITLLADDRAFSGTLYYILDNLSSADVGRLELYLYYFAIQTEPRLPRGYLRKHYRYFRDNSTALKRRNFIGCKNTIGTTIDGLPPVQVFLSEDTEVSVSPTNEGTAVNTGGDSILRS